MILTAIAILVALGLKLLLGWSFWVTLILISVFFALGFAVNKFQSTWVRVGIAIVAIAIVGLIGLNLVRGQLPLTSQFSPYFWLGLDTKLAAKSDPATKAKATILLLQTEREDEATARVEELFRQGNRKGALQEIKKLEAEGQEVRNIISPPNSKNSQTVTNTGGTTTPPSVGKATPTKASVAPTVSKQSAPPASSTAVTTMWKFHFTDPDTLEGFHDEITMVRDGDIITMTAKYAKTIFKGTRQPDGWYAGKMTGGGAPDGIFEVSVGRMSATGSWLIDKPVTFQMERDA